MKKLLIFLITIVIYSCSQSDDSGSKDFQEWLPIETALVPTEFVLGETYEIVLTYLRPTDCHAFNDIYYVKQGQERTVAILSTVFSSNAPCAAIQTELEASFNFEATELGLITFKFWQGEDENGADTYLIVEVPVI